MSSHATTTNHSPRRAARFAHRWQRLMAIPEFGLERRQQRLLDHNAELVKSAAAKKVLLDNLEEHAGCLAAQVDQLNALCGQQLEALKELTILQQEEVERQRGEKEQALRRVQWLEDLLRRQALGRRNGVDSRENKGLGSHV